MIGFSHSGMRLSASLTAHETEKKTTHLVVRIEVHNDLFVHPQRTDNSLPILVHAVLLPRFRTPRQTCPLDVHVQVPPFPYGVRIVPVAENADLSPTVPACRHEDLVPVHDVRSGREGEGARGADNGGGSRAGCDGREGGLREKAVENIGAEVGEAGGSGVRSEEEGGTVCRCPRERE